MRPTSSNFCKSGRRAAVVTSLVALLFAPTFAWTEEEGDADDAAEESAGDDDRESPTPADRSNETRESTALPAGVWLIRDRGLWRVATKGGTPTHHGPLPDGTVDASTLMASPSGSTLAVEQGGLWWYSPAPNHDLAATWQKLPCAGHVSLQDAQVFCLLDPTRNLWGLIALPVGKPRTITLPSNAQAMMLETGDLVWTSEKGILRAKGLDIAQARVVGPHAPLERFSVAPNGAVALGRFDAHVRQAGVKTVAPRLFTMRLDGVSSKRRSTHDAKPLTWSEDAHWALVQDDESACIIAATGGHYRCFEHLIALDISPSGEWALMRDVGSRKLLRGQRSGTKAPPPAVIINDRASLAIWDHRETRGL